MSDSPQQQDAPPPDPPPEQIVLDPTGTAAKAARGELFKTIMENTAAYNASPETP